MVNKKLDKEPIIVSASDSEWSVDPSLETLIREIEGTHSAMEIYLMKDKILFHLKKSLDG